MFALIISFSWKIASFPFSLVPEKAGCQIIDADVS